MPKVDRTPGRPRPEDWGDDDPMTLLEFAKVFSDRYPVTISSMRQAIAEQRLVASYLRGCYWVTPANVREMFLCPVPRRVPVSISDKTSLSSGLSETALLRSAQDAALSSWTKPKNSSPTTSGESGRRGQKTPLTLVKS